MRRVRLLVSSWIVAALLASGVDIAPPAGSLVGPAQAATIAGVTLPERIALGARELVLTSCGVRDTLWVDHYVAALYLRPGAPAVAARDPRAPKAVMLRIVESRFLPDQIPQKWRRALRQELEQQPMTRIRQAFRDLADGDIVLIGYLPQRGVTMAVNGTAIVEEPGHEVIDSILDAWAERDPLDGKLRRLLLEKEC